MRVRSESQLQAKSDIPRTPRIDVSVTFTGSAVIPIAHVIKNLNNATITMDMPQRIFRLTPGVRWAHLGVSTRVFAFPLQDF